MSKLVSLSNEAYSLLSKRKLEGESFSTVVVRLAGKDQSGILDIPFATPEEAKDLERWKKEIYENRRKQSLRTFKV
ncbi:MAG: antitoxin VapB family protein [Candidatus Micrarchaeia archaeon]|jgi:predicted CopG family antitoxin